ncbi:uncharacterized protein LOC132201019 [Neocloeon triangulifer]|uniref:uncharacterized protein LOC132201019 n=1 Tax=Neocloeon triangulifer TaxID=2078957 RepID=UPI00286F118D|nr:uncharacterized protein LOC132201019 [Neocloeon triangulifer]
MSLLWLSTLALLCLGAQGQPFAKNLTEDVSAATLEVRGLQVHRTTYATTVDSYANDVDTYATARAQNIVDELVNLQLTFLEINNINDLFGTGLDDISRANRRINDQLRRIEPTLNAAITALEGSNWVELNTVSGNLRNQIASEETTYNDAVARTNRNVADIDAALKSATENQANVESVVQITSMWKELTTFLSGKSVADDHEIFIVRSERTLTAIQTVLDGAPAAALMY